MKKHIYDFLKIKNIAKKSQNSCKILKYGHIIFKKFLPSDKLANLGFFII